MDYNSESDLIESLDYLTLPVKRSSSIENLPAHKHNTRFLRDFRKINSNKTHTSHLNHDSLILNSTKQEIVEYYALVSATSVSNSTNCSQRIEIPSHLKDKSVIKVTITPTKVKANKTNVFNRRKQNPKHIHSTASAEDRSLQTKHMYLVVSGRTRERHYNIKTTESAKLLNDTSQLNDDISLEQVKSFKQVINSLDMDKKRKKSSSANKRTGSPKGDKALTKKTEKDIPANNCQSVVRITGQIGLGDDNQLLLRCGVEGTKVPTTMDMTGRQNPYFIAPRAGKLQHTVTQGTQMDFVEGPFYTKNVTCFCDNVADVNTFGTNFNNYSNVKRCQSPLVVITVYPNDERCENVQIFKQRPHSPLLNTNENYTNVHYMPEIKRTNQNQTGEKCVDECDKEINTKIRKRRSRSASRDIRIDNQSTGKKDARNSGRSRSRSRSSNPNSGQNIPSRRQGPGEINSTRRSKSPGKLLPSKKAAHDIKQKGTENKESSRKYNYDSKITRDSNRPISPKSQSPDRNPKQNKQRLETKKIDTTKNTHEQKSFKDSNIPKSRSPSENSNQYVKRQGIDIKKRANVGENMQRDLQRKENKTDISHVQTNLISTATNTEHALTKKALVDTFTNEIMGQMGKHSKKKNSKKPQNDESQVTINIDDEIGNYDVILQQGATTNVRVRKTVKQPTEKNCVRANCDKIDRLECKSENVSKSRTNLAELRVDDFQRHGNESPTSKNDNFGGAEIKVRDSLEIGHKRKERASCYTMTGALNVQNKRPEVREAESFAQIKHYRGDKCAVPDPIARDREVRRLLALEKPPRNECCPCQPIPRRKRYFWPLYHEDDSSVIRKTKKDEIRLNKIIKTTNKQTTGTQYESPKFSFDCTSKNTILNQNIQVFVQLEKYTNQKPIILSRKQYHKMKRAIENTISKSKQRHKLLKAKCSITHMSDVKKKENQTMAKDRIEKASPININAETKANNFVNDERAVLFTREFAKTEESLKYYTDDRQLLYSEFLYGSSTKVAVGSSRSHSIHTIFRGFKKCHTPNLGTSTCSFSSESSNNNHDCKYVKHNPPLDKPRKPFLKRLMSCLILRQSSTSEMMVTAVPKRKPSYNSTVDSYHINTSLGALEMSSSIFDTSESFYSTHSIRPLNSKIHKQGFFGSVRGLLAYGKK